MLCELKRKMGVNNDSKTICFVFGSGMKIIALLMKYKRVFSKISGKLCKQRQGSIYFMITIWWVACYLAFVPKDLNFILAGDINTLEIIRSIFYASVIYITTITGDSPIKALSRMAGITKS